MEETRTKVCPSCRYSFSSEYEICPQCGRIVTSAPEGHQKRGKIKERIRIALMILSAVWMITYSILLWTDVLGLPEELLRTEVEETDSEESALEGDTLWTSIFA